MPTLGRRSDRLTGRSSVRPSASVSGRLARRLPEHLDDRLSERPSMRASDSSRGGGGGSRVALLVVLLAVGAPSLLGGCVTRVQPADEQGLRQAAIERWSRCVERRSEAFAEALVVDDAGRYVERGCEGHRRDVVNAFPPHMERRLERALDERAARRARTHLRKRVRELPRGSLVKRLFDGLPPD